jgi:hypothetical protein
LNLFKSAKDGNSTGIIKQEPSKQAHRLSTKTSGFSFIGFQDITTMSSPITPAVQENQHSSNNVTSIGKESPDVTIVDEEASELKGNLRENPDAREAFLAEFSANESKEIMSKVDNRFFILIGLMFLVKNVCYTGFIHTCCSSFREN